uniref:NS1 n=1 Tax=Arundo donax TaxID=35708 RepID=A0A0A8YWJ0_ARUDO
MIEPELAFADLNDDMACATAYLQYVVKYILENCKEDMDFFNTWVEKGIIDRLNDVVEKNFVHLSYSDAVELLLGSNKKFEFPVKWGLDLQSEHERYITEVAFGGRPVIIRDYPKEIKAFYMRQNDDGKTVAAMDLLVPRVGELIGGSQREERLDHLEARLDEQNLNKDSYWWYLDLRRYGSVPHAGFGLGFERLVQFATGIDNIRDAIPFPRVPGSAEF